MILLNYHTRGQIRLGVKTRLGVVDVGTAVAALAQPWTASWDPDTLDELLKGGTAAQETLQALVERAIAAGPRRSYLLDEETLRLAPCVPNPGKIICLGLNYRAHAAETNAHLPEYPMLFSKFSNAVAAARETIPLPAIAEQYDYEEELAVVIGRTARYVSEDEALQYVFGYCNANDLSARELQRRTSQFLLGKTLNKFMPIGPYLVTGDEVGDPQALGIRCWLNGDLRQDSTTADMVFSVAALVSYISRYIPLEPGDIILTGTPQGVINGRKDKVWLKPGDEVTVEIDKLGRLTNVMGRE